MRIGIPKEITANERRVAATPATVQKLIKLGFDVSLQKDAGVGAAYPDQLYVDAGAEIVDGAEALWSSADIVLKVRAPRDDEVELLPEGKTLISFLFPATNEDLLERLAKRKATVFSVDTIPRTSRAQKMDALSSMANIAGYRAVIEAASHFGSFFTGQITAAGRVPPAKVLVIGAGVAGLAAIGAARGLGGVVRAFDTRAAVKEEVSSLGAEFLELSFEESGEGKGGYAKVMSKEFIEAEMALFLEQAKEIDIVITTALIPGKPAPKLWQADAVKAMKPGSVVVDLAAEQGGNCELTKPGEVVVEHGVTIIGHTDMTSRLATTASQLYGTNLVHLLTLMCQGDDGYHVDVEDDIVRGALVLQQGEMMWPPPPPKQKLSPPPKKPEPKEEATAAAAPEEKKKPEPSSLGWLMGLVAIGLAGLWVYLRVTASAGAESSVSPASIKFLQHLTVFVLACFVGWQVVWNVTAALHTPLMSVTNAISGIIIVGGILQGGDGPNQMPLILGLVAILLAMINISGGFLVTQRMLRMFRRD